MSNDSNYVGIQGNTRAAGESATTSRKENKRNTMKIAFQIGAFLILLVVGVILATSQLNFFQKILTAVVFIFIGNKIASLKTDSNKDFISFWPTVLTVIGWSTLVATLLMSGFGKWSEQVALKTDNFFACAAGDSQAKCEEPVEKQASVTSHNQPPMNNQAMKTVTLETEPVPACGTGWVEMDFPPEAQFKVWWNYAAADFRWMAENSTEWQTELPAKVIKMQACSKVSAFTGDRMKITFKGYNL